MRQRTRAALLAIIFVPAAARAVPRLTLAGDIRFRLEDDWDSHNAAGVLREKRVRERIRARLTAKGDLGDGFTAWARVRTGATDSQQNANLTFKDFEGNPTDKLNATVDRFSLAWHGKTGGVEGGRMLFPFFTQNEYFWDGDIAPLGAAGNVTVPFAGAAKLRLNGGAFTLPVGLRHYSGALYAGQAVLTDGPVTAAAGLFRFQPDRHDPDRLLLLDNNGSRIYSVIALNGQYGLPLGKRRLLLGADVYRNLQGYDDATDTVSRANRHQRTGYVLSAVWGDVMAKGHVQLGYRYSRMEKLAVDASYAHDDAARLGTVSQAALTDLKGHDLFANYAVAKFLILGARIMLFERITTPEDDKRARLDVTLSF